LAARLFCLKLTTKKLRQEVQGLLKGSRKIIEKAQKKLTEGIPVTAEINELKELAKQVRSSHLSLDEQLKCSAFLKI